MKRYLLPLLALAFLPSLLHANGDPVISYSARIRSCNPIPLKVTEVQVVREDLDINVALPFTTVRVAYRLKNNSKKAIHVDYGFPVDFSEIERAPTGLKEMRSARTCTKWASQIGQSVPSSSSLMARNSPGPAPMRW